MTREPLLGDEITTHTVALINVRTGTTEDIRLVCGYHLTDEGNAQRLIAHYGDIIRFCADTRQWYVWDGTRWASDTTGVVDELAKDTVRLIHAEAAFVGDEAESEAKQKRKAVQKWAYQSEFKNRLKNMVDLASTDARVAVNRDVFDAKPELINFPNYTMDLKRRELREHRREDLLTKLTGASYDPQRKSAYFYPALLEALPPEQIIYLQRMLGSMLEATTKNKELLIVYGAPFAAKSSITQAVYAALGDYAKPVDVSLLTKSKHGIASNAARPEIVELEGVRIAWTEETSEGMALDEGTIKYLTSSGAVSARGIYEKQRQIQLQASFVIETNNPPVIDIDNEWQRQALLDRVRVAYFVNTIRVQNRDREVLKRCTEDDDELTAALAWALQGYFDRVDYGLNDSPEVQDAFNAFERAINPLAEFVKEEILFDDGADEEGNLRHDVSTSVADLYDHFKQTAKPEMIERVKNARSFNVHFSKIAPNAAKAAGVKISSKHTQYGTRWCNVQLKEVRDDPEVDPDFASAIK
jgi:putative DNA primase/helicase